MLALCLIPPPAQCVATARNRTVCELTASLARLDAQESVGSAPKSVGLDSSPICNKASAKAVPLAHMETLGGTAQRVH